MRRLSRERKERQLRIQRLRKHRLERQQSKRRRALRKLGQRDTEWRPVVEPYIEHSYLPDTDSRSYTPEIRFPRIFSFFDNPEESLAVLQQLALAARDQRSLIIDQARCEEIELGAETVASALVKDAKIGRRVSLKGVYPQNPRMRQVVIATGIPRVALPHQPIPEEFLVFRAARGYGQRRNPRSDAKSRVTTRLVTYFDECLRHYHASLTDFGRARLARLISEALGNAEEHTGKNDWWVTAYLKQEVGIGDFHITIFNLGKSISETMRDMVDGPMKDRVQAIVDAQRRGPWFGLGKGVDEEVVRTVVALQEHVSRLRGPDQPDRGQGTVDMIEFFYELGTPDRGDLRRRMCILSGSTHILFDGTYRFRPGEDGRTIAFNRENDLRKPPDPEYVRKLKRRFPGTVISMHFALDEAHLAALTGEHRRGDS